MKKFLMTALALLLGLAMTACGGAASPPASVSLLADEKDELAVRRATEEFMTAHDMQPAAGDDTATPEQAIREEKALLLLCGKNGITLTEEENAGCDNYYENTLPMLEKDENPEALNNLTEIVTDSGLSWEAYEAVSEANMKYLLLRQKLSAEVYADDADALQKAIDDCIAKNGL